MTLDLASVGSSGPLSTVSWQADSAMLYALSIGAGSDPFAALQFTTENTGGVSLKADPTFALILMQRSERPSYGAVEPSSVVYGGQQIEWSAELEPDGEAELCTTIRSIEDKGSGAVVSLETVAQSAASGLPLFSATSRLFLRGYGGFGDGSTGTREAETVKWAAPDRPADRSIPFQTRPEQALLYRLNSDRNPLHSDPEFAAKAGFDRPILHGLCTYGFTSRALLDALCESDPVRMHRLDARFARPVIPGEALTVKIWEEPGGTARFRTVRDDGTVVIDQGTLEYAVPGSAGTLS